MVLRGRLSFRWDLESSRKRKAPSSQDVGAPHSASHPLASFMFQTESRGGQAREQEGETFCFLPIQSMYPTMAKVLSHHPALLPLVQIDDYDLIDIQTPAQCHLKAIIPRSISIVSTDPMTQAPWDPIEFLHLDDLQLLEAIDRPMKIHRKCKPTYSFQGKIWAVSPILDIGNSTFLLMELKGATDTNNASCTVVVQGTTALAAATTLVPTQQVAIRQAKKQKWSVPDVMVDTQAGVSDHVFVVDQASQIQSCSIHLQRQATRSTLRGTIVAVHNMSLGRTHTVIHYVDIKHEQGQVIRLFLSYFPMPTHLQLSMRIGSTICAQNMHFLDQNTYYASIRSFIAIESHTPRQGPSERGNILSPLYFVAHLHQSYRQLYCQRALLQWKASTNPNHSSQLPPMEDMVSLLCPTPMNTIRNAYAEFFTPELILDPLEQNHFARAGVRLETTQSMQEAAVSDMSKRLQKYIEAQESELFVGWTCSQIYDTSLLFNGDTRKVVVGGMWDVQTTISNVVFATLSDRYLCMPTICHGNLRLKATREIFVFVGIEHVISSVVCLGKISSTVSELAFQSFLLPNTNADRKNDEASCSSLLLIGHWVFLLSSFFECDWSSITTCPSSPSFLLGATLEDCLGGIEREQAYTYSVLLRKHFRLGKSRQDVFNNWILTLCSAHEDHGHSLKVCSTQSLDTKPTIDIGADRTSKLQLWMSELVGLTLPPERLLLAAVFVRFATSSSTCAMLAGSYDECQQSSASTFTVCLRLPRSAIFLESNRGYARSNISLCDVQAWPTRSKSNKIVSSKPVLKTNLFSFIGIRKILPGMLDRRPMRRIDQPGFAELLVLDPEKQYDPPSVTLADLTKCICAKISGARHETILPSLTRLIRNANVVKITFCRAQGQCMKCFKILQAQKRTTFPKKEQASRKYRHNGPTPADCIIDDLPSFWNIPLSMEGSNESIKSPSSTSLDKPSDNKNMTTTILICPEGCDLKIYAGVKWEFSATIDDGTGQARLYAEREAAIGLLGLSHEHVSVIEAEALLTADGLSYSPSMPPPAYLKHDIRSARYRGIDYARRYRQPLTEHDVMLFMTQQAKADYLLQHHCRYSESPFRKLNFHVRCKPLSDEACLQKTDVDTTVLGVESTAMKRVVTSYALPSLKLNLVEIQERQSDAFELASKFT